MTDSELIEGVLQRDRNAVSLLVNQYQKKVIKTAYYLTGNMEDAEDLSQEIFVEIMNSLPGFRGSSSLSSWIYRITVNRSLNELKRKKRRSIIMNISQYLKNTGEYQKEPDIRPASDINELEIKENRELLHLAIQKLPKRQRTAFVLHKFEDIPYREVAEVMSLSVSSVESLIHRAKINLQKTLVNHFSNYSVK